MMLFRSREAINYLGLLIANRHFLFIDSQQLLKNKFISNVHHQLQRQFGSLTLLESLEDKKWKKQQNQYGDSDHLLLLGQKRFFAYSSSSEQQQKNQIENGSTDGKQKLSRESLVHKWLQLDPTCTLNLDFRQGKNMKHLQLRKTSGGISWSFNFLPEEAYQIVRAMDDLLNTLVAKHQQQEMRSSSNEPGPVVLESKRINADFYDFQLELIWLGNGSNVYEFKIKSIKTIQEHKEKELHLPIRALPWIRQTMAQILTEQDGSQQLGPAPPELPESILKARHVVQNRPPQFRNQTAQFASSPRAAGNLPTNPLSSFFKQQEQPKQPNQAVRQQQQQQFLLQMIQQQLQQLQQQQLQQQQSLPNFAIQQSLPQQQYQFIPTAVSNPAALQLASQHQQLAQLRAQIGQMEAAVAATAAMSMQTNPPPQYHHQQPQNFAGFVQQPLPQFYGHHPQQQFPPPPSFPFGTPFPPQQQQQPVNNQNAAASTAAMLNQLMQMMGQLNQQQTQTAGRKTSTTTNQQNASFQPKKPVNQQTVGQWNRQQQPFNNSQQQTAATGQAMMNKQPSYTPSPLPRVPKNAAGTRVAATEQQNEDNAKLFNEIETMAEELEVEYFREEGQHEVEAVEGRAGGMEEEKAADVEMAGEEQEKKLNEKEEDDNYEERKKKKEKASLGNMFLKGKMRKTATAGN